MPNAPGNSSAVAAYGFYAQREARGIGQTAPRPRPRSAGSSILNSAFCANGRLNVRLVTVLRDSPRPSARGAPSAPPRRWRFSGNGWPKIDARFEKRQHGAWFHVRNEVAGTVRHRREGHVVRPGAIEASIPWPQTNRIFAPAGKRSPQAIANTFAVLAPSIDRRQHVIADRIRQNARRHPVADAVGFAPDVALDGSAPSPPPDRSGCRVPRWRHLTAADRTRSAPATGATRLAGHRVCCRLSDCLEAEPTPAWSHDGRAYRTNFCHLSQRPLPPTPPQSTSNGAGASGRLERHHGIEDDQQRDRRSTMFHPARKLPDEGRLGNTTGPGHQQPGHHPGAQHRR